MDSESKQNLISRLKHRFNNVTDKFNVHAYSNLNSNENNALILFSEYLRVSIDGFTFVLSNAFDESNNYNIYSPVIHVVIHIYLSSLLFYAKMFRGSNGVKRENVILLEGKLFDNEGSVKKFKDGSFFQPKMDRFYIEEFFESKSSEFKLHYKILFQIDKTIAHTDKTDLINVLTPLDFRQKG